MVIGWGLDGRPEIQMQWKREAAKGMHNSLKRWDLNSPRPIFPRSVLQNC